MLILLPRTEGGLYQQEECCWYRNSSNMPSLALHVAQFFREAVCPLDILPVGLDGGSALAPRAPVTHGKLAMIFTWAFGDELERLVLPLKDRGSRLFLVANPPGAAPALAERFPWAEVLPSSDFFRASGPLYSPERLCAASTHITYQFATGCPWRCPFCVWQNKLRLRDPELCAGDLADMLAVVDESVHQDTTGERVLLLGNEITGKSQWLRLFCAALPGGTYWSSDLNVRNTTLTDLRTAARAGLRRARLGIEFLEDTMLQQLGKGHTCAQARDVLHWCQDLGISYRFSLRQGVGEGVPQVERMLMEIETMHRAGLRPERITLGSMAQWPGRKWLPVARLAEPECRNVGSERYPRWVMRLPDDTLAAWRKVEALCREIGWVPESQPVPSPERSSS